MVNALKITPADMVVTATRPIRAGETVYYFDGGVQKSLLAISDIPVFHKVAVEEIPKGAPVIKYGQRIGYAQANIRAGEYVHCHNIDSKKK